MAQRTCESCGQGFWQGRGRAARRCRPCRDGDRYGPAHRQVRAATLTAAVGTACARCGEQLLANEALQLDHDDQDPTRYVGYSHRSCNARAGAIAGNKARAAAYRAAKAGVKTSTPNGSVGVSPPQTVPFGDPPERPVCQRTRAQIDASADPLPCLGCGRIASRCW
jgi:hypothetical protein